MTGDPVVASGLPAGLEELLAAHLGGQRWFAGYPPGERGLEVRFARKLWSGEGPHRMWHALVDAEGTLYQLLIGERPTAERADFLHRRDDALIGSVGGSYFYDATVDPEMARVLLEVASGGKELARRARPLTVEQSNTSLVYDDRLILKIFRRLHEGRNLDVEMTTALAEAGFAHVATPLVTWTEDGYDLAFGQEFLAGGAEGWALALTSLRDLYNSASPYPAESGGDFAAEASRLGRVTAEMHLALAEGFGLAGGEAGRAAWSELVADVERRLGSARASAGRDLAGPAAQLVARLRSIDEPGPALRVHGDYHLGQVMRTDSGWYVLDFEGEPARPRAERVAPASPLKDVAGMLRSFDYAAQHALAERRADERAALADRAEAWEMHNRQSFLDGYRGVKGIDRLLPDRAFTAAVLTGYELDKALYELDYEEDHRPEWVSIPMNALVRLIDGGEDAREQG